MSSKQIREHIKKNIDELPDADVKLAANDFNLYFDYLQARHEMPGNKKLNFLEYMQLQRSISQAEKDKSTPASKIFEAYKRKYRFRI